MTEEDIPRYQEIKRETGLSDAEIAKDYFFVSAPTLSRWKRRYGVKDEVRTVQNYIELRKQGYEDKQICIKWNLSSVALYRWKRRENLPEELFNYGRFTKKGIDYDELCRRTIPQ